MIFLYCAIIAWVLVVALIGVTVTLWKATPRIAEAPWLDIDLSLMTWAPWVAASWYGGWMGLGGCVFGQFLALQFFVIAHELLSPKRAGAGTIRRFLNRTVGASRNHLGLWFTIPALPVFVAIRACELFAYPFLVWILHFPKYRQSEWVNVSRQKFSGLVGHDLVWCLYCDWMTGVYSLGGEMLRNVESFWCPIRFYPGKKCENCRSHFPDLDVWVAPEGNMQDVEKALAEHYSSAPGTPRSWWGHPDRKKE